MRIKRKGVSGTKGSCSRNKVSFVLFAMSVVVHRIVVPCERMAQVPFPHNPCAQAGPADPPRWASRPGELFAGLPKCFEGVGQKEVSCAGQRAPARAARVAIGGAVAQVLRDHPPTVSFVSVV